MQFLLVLFETGGNASYLLSIGLNHSLQFQLALVNPGHLPATSG